MLTNEAQPPPVLATDGGLRLPILQPNVGQKWLGCMLTAVRAIAQRIDLECHLRQASKFINADRSILLDPNVSVFKRLKYYNAVVPSRACVGGGHKAFYNSELAILDVHVRKLCRSIVAPSEVDWNEASTEILHLWNELVKSFVASTRGNTLSDITCHNYWNLARSAGHPPHTWESKLQAHCRYTNFRSWRESALDEIVWISHLDSFLDFCRIYIIAYCACAQRP